jgi:hypothetical protein
MPFRSSPRLWRVLASALAAGLMLAVGGCSQITPLGPDPAATLPQPHHLRSPFTLEAVRARAATQAGGCPAGYVTLPGDNPGQCYRKTGTPVTITAAAVSPVSLGASPKPPAGEPAPPAQYVFTVTLQAAEAPGLTAVTTTAHQVHGSLAISVAGRTWVLPFVAGPFTGLQFQIPLPKSQAFQLHSLLVPAG